MLLLSWLYGHHRDAEVWDLLPARQVDLATYPLNNLSNFNSSSLLGDKFYSPGFVGTTSYETDGPPKYTYTESAYPNLLRLLHVLIKFLGLANSTARLLVNDIPILSHPSPSSVHHPMNVVVQLSRLHEVLQCYSLERYAEAIQDPCWS